MADQEQRDNQTANAVEEQEATQQDGAAQQSQAQDEIAKLQAEKAELFDRLARVQAEFDNYRKRQQREAEEFRHYAAAETIKTFLPILDNFNLALKQETGSVDDIRKGLELIRKQMEDALNRLGVLAIPAHGAEFDPHHHEAIEMVESEEHPENQVIEELQRGYKLRDRLLRPAMVRVAKKK
jgi:molecular chaperone GrpE